MIEALQHSQLLLVSAALITACLTKLANPDLRTPVAYGDPAPSPAFVVRDSRPMAIGLALSEGALGVALLVTPHPSVRVLTVLGFASATWVVSELRTYRPEDGCGCFGALSAGRIGIRCVARTALFTAAAIVALGVPHTGIDVLRTSLGWVGIMLTAEILLFIAVSPEADVLLDRLRSRVPCELRTAPLSETYDILRASTAWREHEDLLVSRTPVDVWRELCWRLFAYQGRVAGQDVEIVFAVSMEEHHPAVRSAILEGVGSEISAPAAEQTSAAGRPIAPSSTAADQQDDTAGKGLQGHVPHGGGDGDTDPGGDGGRADAGGDTGPGSVPAVPAGT
ncbi:MauE/DoxX family redox-associated membrane protein [Actinomadura sp. HBU206391]|uniref:MauE/DoxX family redox-associated membrane protein n=1 Tax=Actinomadura sp. HBU206391 TaxID=2731692 RepID=UPI00165021BE|nr:MauE/DoxX family redox-associated membrane protein [Actinomadura sp. HBU206391]MBC6457107.1 hypothetical protein [Actinomadura sp. HBU206391]